MAKLTTTIEKMNSKVLSNPEKVEKLKKDIKEQIIINDKIDADQVRELIVGWKKVEDRIMTPLTIAKKDSYAIYKEDQIAEKTAKETLTSIKSELVNKFNEFTLPIHEEEDAANETNKKTDYSVNTTGLRKAADKYIVKVDDILKLPSQFVIQSVNERAIIDYYKENGEVPEGIEIEVIKGKYQ